MKKETIEEYKKRGGEVKRLRMGEQAYDPSAKYSQRTHKITKKEFGQDKQVKDGGSNEQ